MSKNTIKKILPSFECNLNCFDNQLYGYYIRAKDDFNPDELNLAEICRAFHHDMGIDHDVYTVINVRNRLDRILKKEKEWRVVK